jgi:hypothetical protein
MSIGLNILFFLTLVSLLGCVCCLLHAGVWLGLIIDLKDEVDIFLRNLVDFHRTTQPYMPEDRKSSI